MREALCAPLVVEADGRGLVGGGARAPPQPWPCTRSLCGRPLTHTADPSCPVEGWQLLVLPPWARRRDDRVRGGAPSVRKPSLAILRGSLGVPEPPDAAPPECAVAAVATARARGQKPPPSPPWGRGATGVPAPRWGCVLLVAYCGPRLPPPSWGRVPLGPAGCPASGGGAVCSRLKVQPGHRSQAGAGSGGAMGGSRAQVAGYCRARTGLHD